MAYTSFADAWAHFQPVWQQERNAYNNMIFYMDAIQSSTTLAQLRGYTCAAFSTMSGWALLHGGIGYIDVMSSPHYASIWWSGQGGSAIDMDDILTAMLAATYDQLQKFIGIEDAYRSAIWDQPFNSEFYAALANGFRP